MEFATEGAQQCVPRQWLSCTPCGVHRLPRRLSPSAATPELGGQPLATLSHCLLLSSCLSSMDAVAALGLGEPLVRRCAIELWPVCLRHRPPQFLQTAVLSMAVLARLAASAGEALIGQTLTVLACGRAEVVAEGVAGNF